MSDASLPPHAPVTNGTLTPGHGEVDASHPHSATTAAAALLEHDRSTLKEVCKDIHQRVEAFLALSEASDVVQRTQEQTRISLGVIDKALRDYGFEQLSLSYNGGKDCLVLLILYLSVLHTSVASRSAGRAVREHTGHVLASHLGDTTQYSWPTSPPPPPPPPQQQQLSKHEQDDCPTSIPSVYAKSPDPFPAVSSFVASSSRRYHLDLTHISTNPGPAPTPHQKSHSSPPAPSSPTHTRVASDGTAQPIVTFRDAFATYLEQNPGVRAIFVGTRRTDPHGGHLTHFDMTDGNWPRFMRIHPVIDWHLDQIWCFLRHPALAESDGARLEYCSMYDEGYTSLGGRGDTVRNPRLKSHDGAGWRPAYEMVEDGEERAGRE